MFNVCLTKTINYYNSATCHGDVTDTRLAFSPKTIIKLDKFWGSCFHVLDNRQHRIVIFQKKKKNHKVSTIFVCPGFLSGNTFQTAAHRGGRQQSWDSWDCGTVLLKGMEMVKHGAQGERAKETVWPRVCMGVSSGFLADRWAVPT